MNKFDWLRAVYITDRSIITDGEKAVLAYVAIFDVLNGGDTFCVRQETIAANTRVSESTVSRALRRAKLLGFLTVSRPRKRGTGSHGADELRLTLTELPVNLTTNSPELPVNLTTNSPELPVKSARVTRQIDGYIKEDGSLHGSLKEAGDESPQPPTCLRHPDGPDHDHNCRACKRVREWRENQQTNDRERQRQQNRSRRAAIDACTLGCDDNGLIERPDGNMRKCKHQNDGKAAQA